MKNIEPNINIKMIYARIQLLPEILLQKALPSSNNPIFQVLNLILKRKNGQVGEVGELSEIFQWKGEVPKGLPEWEEDEKKHLGEELSDVLLYLVRLSDICGIDLSKAALRKLELNAIKYPVINSNNNHSP